MSDFGGSYEEAKASKGSIAKAWIGESEIVTSKQWEGYAKRIERKNLKEKGRSLSFSGIARRANSFIIEIYMEDGSMLVKKGWRDAMKQKATL